MKMYTLTVTTFEPMDEEEKREMQMNRSNTMGRDYRPDMPYGVREVRALHVQLNEDEFAAVKRAAIEAIK